MKYVRLGRSELSVSRVGFGGIPISRVSFEEAKNASVPLSTLVLISLIQQQTIKTAKKKSARRLKATVMS